jgi:hypothetical protein
VEVTDNKQLSSLLMYDMNYNNKSLTVSYYTIKCCGFVIYNLHKTWLKEANALAGNAKGGSITVPLTSCLTGLD